MVGHFLNDTEDTVKIVDWYSTVTRRGGNWNFREYRANKFASELLMPYNLVQEYGNKIIKKVLDKDEKMSYNEFVARLAKLFDVSSKRMKDRLKVTGLFQKKKVYL